MAKKKAARTSSKKNKAAREAAALLAESLESEEDLVAPLDDEDDEDKKDSKDSDGPDDDDADVEDQDEEESGDDDEDNDADDDEEEDEDEDDPDSLLKVAPELVARISSIVGRRVEVMELVENTRQRARDVKSDIFKKVIADYQRQLGEIEKEYEPASKEMCQSLMAISALEVKLREEIGEVNDRIVEMRFRCEVGEFSEEDLFPIEAENQSSLKQLSRRMEIIDQTFDTCRPFLREKDFEEATGRRYHPEPEPEPDPDRSVVSDADGDLVSAEMIDPPVSRRPPPEVFTAGAKLDQVMAVDADEGLPTRFELWPDKEPDDTDGVSDATMASEQLHCYIVLKYQNGSEEYFPLGIEAFAIGRHPQNDLVLSDRGISRRHARVELDSSGRYTIRDLSSGNGIFVNGTRSREEVELTNGDTITMGNCNMIYVERLE